MNQLQEIYSPQCRDPGSAYSQLATDGYVVELPPVHHCCITPLKVHGTAGVGPTNQLPQAVPCQVVYVPDLRQSASCDSPILKQTWLRNEIQFHRTEVGKEQGSNTNITLSEWLLWEMPKLEKIIQ